MKWNGREKFKIIITKRQTLNDSKYGLRQYQETVLVFNTSSDLINLL